MSSRRKVVIRAPPETSDLETLINKIAEKAPASVISASLVNGKLVLEFQGSMRSSKEIVKAVKEVLGSQRPRAYRDTISADELKSFGFRGPFDVLAFVLRKLGHDSEWEPPELRTDAPRDLVKEVSQRLAKANSQLSGLRLSESARKAVMASSALLGKGVMETIDAGLRKGVLVKDKNDKISSLTGWREAVDLLRG